MPPASPKPAHGPKRIHFLPSFAKLTIASIDDAGKQVAAQYNPKELQLTQPISWQDHRTANNQDTAFLEFGGVQPQTTQIELLFDGFERGGRLQYDTCDDDDDDDAKAKRKLTEDTKTVAGQIAILKELATVRDPFARKAELRRPHYCIVVWGESDFPRLRCVIESVVVKYLAWDQHGNVLRASCTLSLKEIDPHAQEKRERDQDAQKRASRKRPG